MEQGKWKFVRTLNNEERFVEWHERGLYPWNTEVGGGLIQEKGVEWEGKEGKMWKR